MNDEMREAFLEWAKLGSEPYDTAYTMNDIYLLCDTQHAWDGFQAAYQLQQKRVEELELELAKYRKAEALHEEYRQSCIDLINGRKS